jgi:hypothetical protein
MMESEMTRDEAAKVLAELGTLEDSNATNDLS